LNPKEVRWIWHAGGTRRGGEPPLELPSTQMLSAVATRVGSQTSLKALQGAYGADQDRQRPSVGVTLRGDKNDVASGNERDQQLAHAGHEKQHPTAV
jgi:hypothetical protein